MTSDTQADREWRRVQYSARGWGQLPEATRRRHAPRHEPVRFDVCVIGGGSGGVGAAMAAARHGARTLLIEASGMLGGTSTQAWVSNWEPVDGATGLPQEIYEAMAQLPRAVVHADYRDGGKRVGGDGLPFEPWAYDQVVRQKLAEAGCVMWFNTRFQRAVGGQDAVSGQHRVDHVEIQAPWGPDTVAASTFIDATADVYVCRSLGCETWIGEDPRDRFDEPAAPEAPERRLNAITLCYRIRNTGVEAGPPETRDGDQVAPDPDLPSRPAAYCSPCPNGDLIVNAVNLIEGTETLQRTEAELRTLAERRVRAHVRWLQRERGFRSWELVGIAPMIGIRETYRVSGEYVLTQRDVEAGLRGQEHPDIIALADHSFDLHGAASKGVRELPNGAYGIPFRCLIPRGWRNLLVACRGASFSHIAASSARLSRTMLMLGVAAGTAAALAVPGGHDARDVPPEELRAVLRTSGVKLDNSADGWPSVPVEALGFSIW